MKLKSLPLLLAAFGLMAVSPLLIAQSDDSSAPVTPAPVETVTPPPAEVVATETTDTETVTPGGTAVVEESQAVEESDSPVGDSEVVIVENELPAAGGAAAAAGGMVFLVVMFVIFIIMIVSVWKIFVKAGEPGWAAIIPIYNIIVYCKICGKPVWWILLLLIPVVSIIIAIILSVSLSKVFGKGVGFAIGLILLPIIFLPILAFGDAEYQGA